MNRSRILLLTVATLAACSGGELVDGGARIDQPATDSAAIRTDQSSYRLAWDGRIQLSVDIPFSFRNPLPHTIYVPNCRGGLNMALERLEDGAWRHQWSPILLMCLSPPIAIPPGTTYRDTMPVLGVLPGHNAGPEFESAEPAGTYRLRWHGPVLHYRDYEPGRGWGDPVPEELLLSNEFVLEDPRALP